MLALGYRLTRHSGGLSFYKCELPRLNGMISCLSIFVFPIAILLFKPDEQHRKISRTNARDASGLPHTAGRYPL